MRLNKFSGLNTIDTPIAVGVGALVKAKNIDIDHNGKISTRQGFTKALDEPIVGMSNRLVLCKNGELLRINSSTSIDLLAVGIAGDTLDSVDCAGNTYFTTGNYNGVMTGSTVRAMGLLPPEISVTVGLGNLPKGNYLVSATSIAEDGRESSSFPAQVISVDDHASIAIFVELPLNAVTANIYCSGQDGEELFYQATSDQLLITHSDALLNSGEPINRENKGVMPFGKLIEEYAGHLLIANDEYLYFSEALDYELCDYANNIIPFESPITMLRSVETGIFISTTDAVFFATGETPDKFVLKQVYSFGAFFNSSAIQSATLIGDGNGIGKSVIFTTQQGICIGNADGFVQNVSERKVKLLKHTGDVSAVILHNRYLVSLVP